MAEVKTHPDFESQQDGLARNDMMLVKLSRPVDYNQFASPVCLPS